MALSLVLLCLFVACGQDAKQKGTQVPLPGDDSTSGEGAVILEPLPLAGVLNPLTGNPAVEGAADGQRPVAVMVGNTQQSLPQRGLASCDVMVEALAEGNDTRLMAMYGDFRTVPQVGPVQSAPDQFAQFAIPSNAIFTHIGSTSYTQNLLNALAYQDVDGTYLGTSTFFYDYPRSTAAGGDKKNEDCWFTDAGTLWTGVGIVNLNPLGEVHTLFNFAPEALPTDEDAFDIACSFSDETSITFHYDETNNNYLKTAFGNAHADEDGTLCFFNNVILLRCNVGLKADGPDYEFDLSGGDGFYFNGGTVYPIRWKKGGPTDPLRLIGENGVELQVQKGKSYIGLIPADREQAITYSNREKREQDREEAERLAAEQAAAEQAAAEQAAAEQAAAEQAAAEQAAAEQAAAEQAAAEAAPA